ncbi:efflux RND transporter permease subunit [Aestuariimicrobium kwangyangense]|uniref:efflux RND transporter permease subunit n=1 Tax=Aestuariimicrobium kwangyangense TaxID=396389 RepID=UPI0003B3464F|nr:efflux RND transporter permease subunit [Aestuariimicrobium kwangyangense]
MHRLAIASLGNRALIALITVFVMAYGIIATSGLKQELLPSIQFPQVYIIASYPGASPTVVEDKVTTPIEQAVLGLQGLESSESTSSTGQSVVIATMKYGSSMNAVQQDVQAAISRIAGVLPDGVDTQVITGSFDSIPVLVLSVADSTNAPDLAQRLNDLVVPRLERLDGVRSVEVSGAPARQVQVTLDPVALGRAGLSSVDVVTALGTNGQLSSSGEITDGDTTMSVTLGQRYTTVDQVKQVMVTPSSARAGSSAPPTAQRLDSVATVELAPAAARSISRTNGAPSVTVNVFKVPDANTVAVADAIKAQLPELGAELGHDARFTAVFDQAPFISQSIHDLLVEGGLGLTMAIVVILVFLLSLRSTLVTAVSIPVSVLATLIGLQIAGYSLNILTLGALTIAIGRVVDDSIVVIENIKRHLSYGEPKLTAIITAVREVAVAVTSATITTVAVFLPIGLVQGQTGELFRPFAMTVALALVASLVVSLTIVPVLAHWFLATPGAGDAETARLARERAEAREHSGLLQRIYLPVLGWSLRHPVVVLVVAALLLGATGAAATRMKTNFLDDAGQNTMSVNQQFPPALSLAEKDRRAAQLESRLRDIPGLQAVQLTVGSEGFNFGLGGSQDSATFNLTLDPDTDKPTVEARIRQVAKDLADTGDITVAATAMAGSSQVTVIVRGPDSERLNRATADIQDAMKKVSGASDVSSSLTDGRPQIQVVPTPQAARLGVSTALLQQLVSQSLSTRTVGRVEQSGGASLDVVVMPTGTPANVAELNNLPVPTATGMVPLSQVASITRTTVPTSIAHHDGQRSATVSLTPTGNDLGALTSRVNIALAAVQLPPGVTADVGGASADQADAFRQLGLALLVAIAIVYVVMVATFKSLVQPLILAVSIPFAATGALAGLLITDTPLGVPALIGVLMLVGIVVTNAIVLIDLVNHYRGAGDSVDQALLDGARRRLRPILMTAVATVFALVPMALGLSGGGVFISKPLAIVVIGGLTSSTLLTLVLVPVLYHLVEGGRERRRARRRPAPVTAPDDARDAAVDESGTPVPPRRAAD